VQYVARGGRRLRRLADYLRYAAHAALACATWRPHWVYVSDTMAAPLGLAATLLPGVRIAYHEHDAPLARATRAWERWPLAARRRLLRRADVVVVPNAERAARLSEEAGGREVTTVWNCPRLDEVGPPRKCRAGALRVVYHGSIVPDRLPLAVIDALAAVPGVELVVAGYETVDSRGYVDRLRARARSLGVGDRLSLAGAVPTRAALLDLCATADVGLALMPVDGADFNMRTMSGASNKAFDYMARGVAPIVSDLPDWRALYVDRGLALATPSLDADGLAEVFRWCAGHRREVAAMGERGRRQILAEWNYDTLFAPVLRQLSADRGPTPEPRPSFEVVHD
jgi:glycosyltransferase involved in cell wall biosynthesis